MCFFPILGELYDGDLLDSMDTIPDFRVDDDEDECFGRLIAYKMRQINDNQIKTELQLTILKMVAEVLV